MRSCRFCTISCASANLRKNIFTSSCGSAWSISLMIVSIKGKLRESEETKMALRRESEMMFTSPTIPVCSIPLPSSLARLRIHIDRSRVRLRSQRFILPDVPLPLIKSSNWRATCSASAACRRNTLSSGWTKVLVSNCLTKFSMMAILVSEAFTRIEFALWSAAICTRPVTMSIPLPRAVARSNIFFISSGLRL